MKTAQKQANLLHVDVSVHRVPWSHMILMQRSDSYRRWYRRFYPLLALGKTAVLLCLISYAWFLLLSLIHLEAEGVPTGLPGFLSLLAAFTPLVQLLVLLCCILRFIVTSIQVVTFEWQLMRWRTDASGKKPG